jgi:O-acetyl-ADP-ribose deacetylase (regulator of RNase III)
MKAKVNKVTIRLMQGDIFALTVDVVVHSTDPTLTISPRLAAAGGPKIEQETLLVGWCDVGSAVMTGAGRLSAQKVIHVVGPKWGEGSERGKLANATWDTLRLVEEGGYRSVALPAIATGSIGGYPVENCARIMMQQIVDYTFEPLKSLREIIICVDGDTALEPFEREFQRQLEDLTDTGSGGKVPVH